MAFPPHILPSVFGILGNIISFCVFLAPLRTFYKIYKKKSSKGLQSVPYSLSLFSCTLLLYYGCLKTENGTMIIIINTIGCAIEFAYMIIFLIYDEDESKKTTIEHFVLLNIGSSGLIIITTFLTSQGALRMTIVGWMYAMSSSVCVFASHLAIIRSVIRTGSVRYMSLKLSFLVTICAVMWFIYGLLIKDYYVAAPNVLGFGFGATQMILYIIYKDRPVQVQPQDGLTTSMSQIRIEPIN